MLDKNVFIYLYLNASKEAQKRVCELLGVKDEHEQKKTEQ